MATQQTLRKRATEMASLPEGLGTGTKDNLEEEHPAGKVKHGRASQVIRALLLVTFFLGSCLKYVHLAI
jgi:hypothetical protein